MKDKGIVISAKNGYAQVEVECLSACHDCSAHSLCIGHNTTPGIISVKNTVLAAPGDAVVIGVPEGRYNRALITLFGGGLAAALGGITSGYLGASVLAVSREAGAFVGLLLGLLSGAFFLSLYFKKELGSTWLF